jgi:hypothetical protein
MSKERIEILKAEIFERQQELRVLSKESIKNETDIHKKFQAWADNGLDKKCRDYIPPYDSDLGKWIEVHLDLGSMRGCVDLLEMDEFRLFAACEEDLDEYFDIEELNKLKNDPIFVNACRQMIEENIDSFEINW